jgi:hypothetical protein
MVLGSQLCFFSVPRYSSRSAVLLKVLRLDENGFMDKVDGDLWDQQL